MKLKLISFLTILAMIAAPFAEAKGGGGFSSSGSRGSGGFSSSSRSSSSSSRPSSGGWGSSSSSKSSSSGAKAPSSSTSSGWGSSKPNTAQPQTSTRTASKVDAARYQSAAKSGKAFQSRDAALADFKTKNATQYKSTFASEPTTRPSYIPQTYSNGGRTYNVTYNQNMGGYGYYNPLGAWIMYDIMTDNRNLNTVMANQGYYVGQPVHYTSGWTIFGYVFGVIVLVVLFSSILIFSRA